MNFIQADTINEETTKQKWGNYFAIGWGIISIFLVINIRQSVLTATSTYINNEAGIVATYPAKWLLTEGERDYIFQVSDVQTIGYKTTYRVSLRPVSTDTTQRTIIDTLAMVRSQTLAAYRILETEPYPIAQDPNAQLVTYTFVDTATNPFLEQIPVVVIALDVVTISRGQSVIITMLSDSSNLEQNTPDFFRFIDELEF